MRDLLRGGAKLLNEQIGELGVLGPRKAIFKAE